MTTPWDRAKTSGAARGKRQEDKLAKRKDIDPQVNSGRIWSSLRDLKMRSFIGRILIDAKTTEKNSYRLERNAWKQLKRDANRTPPGCHAGMQIDIQDVSLIVVDLATWDEVTAYMIWLETRLQEVEISAPNQS